MTVCMMNDSFFRSSGSAIAIRRIAESLEGIEYCVAGSGDREPEDLSWIPEGRYRRFDLKSLNPLRIVSELRRFRLWADEQGCDLVHCHHRRLSVLLRLTGVPVLYTGHNAFPWSVWFRWLHPRCMTAVTPSVADNLRTNTGVQVLAVIGNPVTFPPTAPDIEVKQVQKRAVCIARLDPVKGHRHLLAAWRRLHECGYECHLDLIGEGPLRRELERQVQEAGISHLVHFHGFIRDVSSVIKQSLFAILVSESEGQGLVTLEAAAVGRASLLTAVPGSIDLLPPDRRLENGLTYGDVTQLADTLENWFAEPDEVVREGKAFFDFLKHSSDAATIAREYRKVYQKMPGIHQRRIWRTLVPGKP